MKRFALAAAIVLAGLGAPAFAQTSLLKNFSWAEMRTAIEGAKATVKEDGLTDNGTRYLTAKDEDGLNFNVYGHECDTKDVSQRCTGAELSASFTLKNKDDVAKALAGIDYAAVADDDDGEGKIKMVRYLIFDEGITSGNLRVNVEVFLSISNKVWTYLSEKGFM